MKKLLALSLAALSLSLTFAAEAYRPAPIPSYLSDKDKTLWQEALDKQAEHMNDVMYQRDSSEEAKKKHAEGQKTMNDLREKYKKAKKK